MKFLKLFSFNRMPLRKKTRVIPNVVENLDLGPSQSPGIGRSNLAPISNRGDDSIAPIAGAFASAPNPILSHVRYKKGSNKISLKTQGILYDLQSIYNTINASYFDGKLDLKITWF